MLIGKAGALSLEKAAADGGVEVTFPCNVFLAGNMGR